MLLLLLLSLPFHCHCHSSTTQRLDPIFLFVYYRPVFLCLLGARSRTVFKCGAHLLLFFFLFFLFLTTAFSFCLLSTLIDLKLVVVVVTSNWRSGGNALITIFGLYHQVVVQPECSWPCRLNVHLGIFIFFSFFFSLLTYYRWEGDLSALLHFLFTVFFNCQRLSCWSSSRLRPIANCRSFLAAAAAAKDGFSSKKKLCCCCSFHFHFYFDCHSYLLSVIWWPQKYIYLCV